MKKILIIDDEAQILLLSAARLKANGYHVLTALSGDQGLKKAKKELPDLVFLDYVMPEMDGGEVLDCLKKKSVTKHIPVVMFTADAKKVIVEEMRMRGAAGCLFKPFTAKELLSKVNEILN